MTNNFHDLITRMAKELDNYRQLLLDDRTATHRLSDEARAVLADGPAVPQGREPASVVQEPSDAELVGKLVEAANGAAAMGWGQHAQRILRAAELLERQVMVPVSVSERLPGPSDCAPWPKDSDASAWCWVGTDQDDGWNWEQRSAGCLAMFPDDFTHWLPAHALPLPEVGE